MAATAAAPATYAPPVARGTPPVDDLVLVEVALLLAAPELTVMVLAVGVAAAETEEVTVSGMLEMTDTLVLADSCDFTVRPFSTRTVTASSTQPVTMPQDPLRVTPTLTVSPVRGVAVADGDDHDMACVSVGISLFVAANRPVSPPLDVHTALSAGPAMYVSPFSDSLQSSSAVLQSRL